MPTRAARRKQRYQSEPLPTRASAESSECGDELDPDVFTDAEADSKTVAHGLLNAQAQYTANKIPSSHFAFDSQLRTSSGKARTATTTATATATASVAFPLTPTSAAGEADRTMASLTPAINNGKNSQKGGASEVAAKDKMSHPSTINDPSPRPPPPDISANNPSLANTVRAPSSHAYTNGSAPSASAVPRIMSHRLESPSIRPRHFQDQHFHDSYYSAHPSPPPITTLTHSPSLSSDRSSVNSPAPTILPPLAHPGQFQPQPYLASGAHRYPATAQPGAYHHSHYYSTTVSPPEVFAAPAQSYAHAYGGGYAPPPPTHVPFHHATDMSMSSSQQYSVNPYATTGSLYGHGGHGGGGSGGYTPIYTDDASTKLSDRVRRRCFNCCTTDTSTWRRSSLNPGKVLCNKCGLFERTHSRPRPDQFPHKRAPLQIPTQNIAHDAVNAAQSMNSGQPHVQTGHGSNTSPHNLPPTTAHPSLGAAYNHPSALPQIQEWLRPNSSSGSGAANNAGSSSASSSASSSRAHSASSAADNRHHPYASSVPASGAGAGPGTGESRSPRVLSARLSKRSDSVNSDMVDAPPVSQQRRSAQNLTPSPSPPPEVVRSGGAASTAESSPRMHSISIGAGADTGKP